jgi:hypothetical protein
MWIKALKVGRQMFIILKNYLITEKIFMYINKNILYQ